MSRLFDMDNGVFRFLGRLADLMILNLIFIATCIPIITIGAAWTALYYVALKMVRNEESYIIRGYLKSFKENFKQATILWIGVLIFVFLLFMDYRILAISEGGTVVNVIRIGIMMVTLVGAMTLTYLFPVLSKFYNTIRYTLQNAILMSIRHFPQTILMLVISAAAVVVTWLSTVTIVYGILVWLMFGFSLIAYINSWFLVRIFDKYIPKNEEDEKSPDDFTVDMDTIEETENF